MYGGTGSEGTVVTGGAVVGAGAILLPNTADNILAIVLAYTAIAIGVLILGSHLAVRIARHRARS